MEAKLKALKVADLRELLQKSSVSIPAKANKADLVAKILGTPAAVDVFNKQNGGSNPTIEKPVDVPPVQDDDLLAPPEEFDWNTASGGAKITPATKTVVAPEAKPKPELARVTVNAVSATPEKKATPAVASTSVTAASTAVENEELERRKKRAARFGIPLVEPKQQPTPSANGAKAAKGAKSSLSPDEQVKVDARAARFGVPKTSATATATASPPAPAAAAATTPGTQKRKDAPTVDQEELERRKRRTERFGGNTEKKT